MNSRSDLLPGVVQEAETEGAVAEPGALFEALAAIENPVVALAGHDEANALFAAFYSEFGFLMHARAMGPPLEPSERNKWVSLVRWTIRELKAWRAAADPASRKLVAIFIAAQANDWDNGFWEHVPEEIGKNAELVQRLKALISSFSTGTTTRGGLTPPIWEREAVKAFQTADREGDWIGIANAVRLFEHQLIPGPILMQPVRCLYRCGVAPFTDALENLHQTVIALQIARALRVDQCLAVAVRSSNPYVEFAAVYQTVSGRPALPELAPGDQHALTTVLLKIAADESRWQAWMSVFNTFPVQRPALQASLGAALAQAPDIAIDPYVNAIVLFPKSVMQSPTDPSRRCVAACLREFRARAVADRRALLWTKAYERWRTWDFDRANPQTHLVEICRSDLDYAIVGFASECLDDAGRAAMFRELFERLKTLENSWYASISDCLSEFRRIMSAYQPLSQAEHALQSGDDWFTETKVHFPFAPSQSEYWMMRYQCDLRESPNSPTPGA
jgi:hypothetical protein